MTGPRLPEDPRDALIREQAALITGLSTQVTDLSAQIGELTALVWELREQLEAARRAASRNSGNSSMPPSADDLPGRKVPAGGRKPGARAKPGKQPSAPGAHLSWPAEPDETVPLFPEDPARAGGTSQVPLTWAWSRQGRSSTCRWPLRRSRSTTSTRSAAAAGRSTRLPPCPGPGGRGPPPGG